MKLLRLFLCSTLFAAFLSTNALANCEQKAIDEAADYISDARDWRLRYTLCSLTDERDAIPGDSSAVYVYCWTPERDRNFDAYLKVSLANQQSCQVADVREFDPVDDGRHICDIVPDACDYDDP